MSDQFGPSSAPKTLNCPTCGYLMEVKYLGDLKDKKAVCPACNTKVDLDDSFARTHKRITRKRGLFGTHEVEEIISEERSDLTNQPSAPLPPQQNVFGQYTTPPKPGQPYPPPQRPVQTPQVFVSGGTYTYTPGKAKTSSGGSTIGCVILLIVLTSIIVPIGAGIYFAIDAASNSSTNIKETTEAIQRGVGIISEDDDIAFQSWKILNGHTRAIKHVAFSPNGLNVASTSDDDTLRLWDISTGETIAEITGVTFEEPSLVAFSPDGRYLVTASDSSGKVKFYDAFTAEFEFQIDTTEFNINGLAFSPDSTKIAVSDYKNLYVYDINSRSRLTEAGEDANRPYFSQLLYSPDGKLVYARASQAIYVWDLTTKSLNLLISAETSSYSDMTITPDGTQLVLAGSGSNGVQFINLADGRIVKSMPGGFGGGADAVGLNPAGTLLATGGFFGDFFLYEVDSGKLKYAASEDLSEINSIAFSPNGNVIVVGTGAKEIRLFLTSPNADPYVNVTAYDPNVGDVVGFSSPTPAPVIGCVITTRDTARKRSGPGTDYVVQGSLDPGESSEADAQTKGTDGFIWWRLVDGTWVRSDIVEETGNCSNLPTVTP